jgi:penicillin amidase
VKIIKKIAKLVLLLLILAVTGGYLYVRHIGRKGLPDYIKEVRLSGIQDDVTVYRDAHAVPHIFAKNEDDLYRAVGYVMAQDRLWQMDLIRRAAQGRLAEIFGPDLVETDLLLRVLRIPEKSRLVLGQTEKPIVDAVSAFADGVNQYIDTHLKRLPLEFSLLGYVPEKWTPEHSMNLIGYMAKDLALALESDLLIYRIGRKLPLSEGRYQELIPNIRLQETIAYPEFFSDSDSLELRSSLLDGARRLADLGLVIFSGSNNWAISGARSGTGKPILANDMHLALFAPGIWYQIHEVVDGRLNVTGLALPGAPFVVAGHNERIAWGMTNVMNDDADFYLEKINPANPDEYEFNGAWRPLEIKKEVIKVNKGNPVERKLRFTHRGPVVSELREIKDVAISMRWVGNDMSNEARSAYLLNRASDWDDFTEAVRSFRALSQNIIYADVDGNIGLYCCAGVPIRKQGIGVVSGETDEYDWKGYVPFEELPHVYNPSSGVVASANNKIAADEYPHYISYLFDPGYRIDRIREMLGEKDKLSVADFCRMQADVRSKLAEKSAGDLLSSVKKVANLNPMEAKALSILESWDFRLTADSAAAFLFEKLFGLLQKNLIEDELGEDLGGEYIRMFATQYTENILADKSAESVDDVRTPDVRETFGDIVQRSFRQAVAALEKEQGREPEFWEWGRLHRLRIDHPMGTVRLLDRLFHLNRGPTPVGGSFHTVCPYVYPIGGGFDSRLGASHRHVYSMADWNDSVTIIPTGESGIPASPFYCDQTELYVENKYHNDYVDLELVEKNSKFRMTIKGKNSGDTIPK